MRSVKSQGGLTRGRGFPESVRILWVYSMHKCASIQNDMSDLINLTQIRSEQHVELGKSRIQRDFKDLSAMMSWLSVHNPFDETKNSLRSMSSGATAIDGEGINCDAAENVAASIQEKMDCLPYAQSSIKRNEQVKTLAFLQKGVHVGDETVYVCPYVLFTRLIINVERSEDMKSHFEFELSPAPPALFKDLKMRKANKASLIPLPTKDVYSIDHIDCSYNT